jgi:hypothetical protein
VKFNIANKAPINVSIDGTDYALKRFTRGDWVAWASAVDGRRVTEATEGLDAIQRSRLLLIYPVEPVGHADLIRRLYTPEGTGHVIRTCAVKSGVPTTAIDALLEQGDERDLETLAVLLASIVDPSEAPATEPPKAGEADPLPSSAKG